MRELKDKVIVITGAASGIGAELARQLHAKGATLALGDVDQHGRDERAGEISDRVSIHVADVGDRERMASLPAEVIGVHGHVDVLINNAGVTVGAMFADHSIDDAEWLLQINLMGVIYGCKFFLPHLLDRPEAHIVNLSSIFGLLAMPGQAIYSASKAGIRAFTEALWTELAGTSVRVTTVHPGAVKTNVIRSSRMPDEAARARAVELQDRFAMPVERAAARIIRAVERNRRRVLVGVDAHIGAFLKSLFPVALQRAITLGFRLSGSRD
jgi:short-subunit dehydrogenase